MQNRVVVICVCFMFLSIMIVGLYLCAVMYAKVYEGTYERTQIYTEKTAQNIDQSLSFISNTALAVATSGSAAQWISNTKLFDKDNPAYYKNLNQMKSETFHVLTYSNAWKESYVRYICILEDDEPLLYVCGKQMSQSAVHKSAKEICEYARKKDASFVGELPPVGGSGAISYLRTLKREFTAKESLSILIVTDEKALRRQYAGSGADTVDTYLIDGEGTVFSSNEETLIGKKCDEALLEGVLRDKNGSVMKNSEEYLYFSQPLEANQLTLVNVVPKSYIVAQTFQGLPLFFAIAGGLSLLLLLLGFMISYKSTDFIQAFANGMNRVMHKDYDVKMPKYRNESVNMLSRQFNDMTSSMKTLINDTYEAKIMKQEMELEFIQQQMNPHFLFNTLSVIQIKAMLCGDKSIYQMLTSLSGLLRASLYSGQNTMSTLQEEVKYVEFYLFLQQQRYEQRLSYQIILEDGLKDIAIPRLTIEPIVENSVVHGMEGIDDKLTVSVTVKRQDADVWITVADNGGGFDTAGLNLERSEPTPDSTREKIGLRNTNCRLKLMYGDEYGLHIESLAGKGTVVLIHIPAQTREKGRDDTCTG